MAGKVTGDNDLATKLTNEAINGIRSYGLNSLKARDNLPAVTWNSLAEWGGWHSWAALTDERMDRARYQLKSIIERHLKTAQTGSQAIESGVDKAITLTEEQKRAEALKRDELHSDPEKRKELANLAQDLAKDFGFA